MSIPLRSSGLPPGLAALLSTLAVAVIAGGAVAWELTGQPAVKAVAATAMLLFMALEAPALARGGRIMLGACLACAAAAWALLDAPGATVLRGLTGAALVVGLLASLSLLRDAAQSSALVQRCGDLMVRQPPGRRFLVLAVGSHLIAVVLNFGVLTLLGTMVLRGNTLEAAGGDARIAAIRTRRMLTAVLRGFVTMTVWSPLSVSFAVTTAAIPGLDWWRLMPLQMLLGAILLGVAWAVDRSEFPRPAVPPQRPAMAWRPLAGLTGLIAAVVAGAMALALALGVRPIAGAMMAVPVAAWLWLTAQHRGAGFAAPWQAARRLGGRLTVSMPAFRNEFVIIGGATFVGTVGAAFIPPQEAARLVAALPLPGLAIMVLLAWAIMVLARYGVPQIVTVTVFGQGFAHLTQHGIEPMVLASGLMGAWALSACTTPVGAATLMIARMAGVPGGTAGSGWNGRFLLAGAVVLAAWMWALDAVR
ncbi:hypothetical protein [Azospirillum sp. ST 5-10]|uniref:hypothetical protein n=1 Tax=unclassified Azospirillum TaxID=2630922 RepID=UPI003F4A715E